MPSSSGHSVHRRNHTRHRKGTLNRHGDHLLKGADDRRVLELRNGDLEETGEERDEASEVDNNGKHESIHLSL